MTSDDLSLVRQARRQWVAHGVRRVMRCWVAQWMQLVLQIHEARHLGVTCLLRGGWRRWHASWSKRLAVLARTAGALAHMGVFVAWREWHAWICHRGVAIVVMGRVHRFFAGWRLVQALRACVRQRGRLRALEGLSDALSRLRSLEALQRGWRTWRQLGSAEVVRYESRAAVRVHAALRRGWISWCRDRLVAPSASGARWRSIEILQRWQVLARYNSPLAPLSSSFTFSTCASEFAIYIDTCTSEFAIHIDTCASELAPLITPLKALSSHANGPSYLAQGWRLGRAFHTLMTRIAPKEARLLRLARSTGDLTRKARALRQWANGCEQSIVKHARLQQAARRFERTRERLQMATALGAMNAAQVMDLDGP